MLLVVPSVLEVPVVALAKSAAFLNAIHACGRDAVLGPGRGLLALVGTGGVCSELAMKVDDSGGKFM